MNRREKGGRKMVEVINDGVYLYKGKDILGYGSKDSIQELNNKAKSQGIKIDNINKEEAKKGTIAYEILTGHNTSKNDKDLKIKFDALASHDITYVGIIQTAKASGLKEFPIPYVLTNCHNSLCAVGGTINEDDHIFGLSAAKKYGGIYVPAHIAVIHQYMREMMAGCGKMILGSDSHTRYGALGCMAIGEGGPELVKQLLSKTYDIAYPDVIAVYLDGTPKPGVGPQDVALAIIKAVFKSGFVKNKVLEFVGPGVENLTADYRIGIDVMTTETTCLSSIWMTDDKIKEFYVNHGRIDEYKKLEPEDVAYYDGIVKVDLDKVECMIALPFHPSNAFTINELNSNAKAILEHVEEEGRKQLDNPKIQFKLTDKIVNGKLMVDQGIVAGCAGGTYENVAKVAEILNNNSVGKDYFNFSVYPSSQPVYLELVKNGAIAKLIEAGVTIKTAFCGPCFGAGDVPGNNALSIRHTTRNFPSREGSKPGDGQISSVALMDALSIAATAINGGVLTPATDIEVPKTVAPYEFNGNIYEKRVYNGYKNVEVNSELKFGPNIAEWPKMQALTNNILLKVASVIKDPVTTTDELIPSGETSSYRSNPLKLAEFTLSRKDPKYVGRSKETHALEINRQNYFENKGGEIKELKEAISKVTDKDVDSILKETSVGSVVYAIKPGDGSAREQAASCQKVLGGFANIASEYATKRYRSNLINWGMIPFTMDDSQNVEFNVDDYIFVEGIKKAIEQNQEEIKAKLITKDGVKEFKLDFKNLSKDERDIILAGCLINYYGK
jgi:aconitate hydratase